MLIKCSKLLEWDKLLEGMFRELWKQFNNWKTEFSRWDVGRLPNSKRMSSVITVCAVTGCECEGYWILPKNPRKTPPWSVTWEHRGQASSPGPARRNQHAEVQQINASNSKLCRQRYVRCEGQGPQQNWMVFAPGENRGSEGQKRYLCLVRAFEGS